MCNCVCISAAGRNLGKVAISGDKVLISGSALRRLRDKDLLTPDELGERIGLSREFVTRVEREGKKKINRRSFRKLVNYLHLPPDAALKVLQEGLDLAKNPDQNIDPFSEQKIREIPTFDLAVAAGKWADVHELGEVHDPLKIDHGLFRVRIRGDSMSPRFKEGQVVEFRCLRDGRDSLEIGAFYYVQRDGQATFKMLEKVEEARIILRAVNRKRYPCSMPVDRRSIVRMARAIGIHEPV